MTNLYFPDEEITKNDLYFMCYMVERVARKLKQHNAYVVNTIGEADLRHLISVANVLHSVNPMQVEADWITDYHLQQGTLISLQLIRIYASRFRRLLRWARYICVLFLLHCSLMRITFRACCGYIIILFVK